MAAVEVVVQSPIGPPYLAACLRRTSSVEEGEEGGHPYDEVEVAASVHYSLLAEEEAEENHQEQA